MGEWVNGWMVGWLVGWMDGWMESRSVDAKKATFHVASPRRQDGLPRCDVLRCRRIVMVFTPLPFLAFPSPRQDYHTCEYQVRIYPLNLTYLPPNAAARPTYALFSALFYPN
jgi:hypothetical protein